jgi:hypothetical protein
MRWIGTLTEGNNMKYFIIMTIVFNSALSFAKTCPFADGEFGEVITTPEFSTTEEVRSKIPKNVFWANRDFFSGFNSQSCTNAFVTSEFEQLSTGDKFYYYRSVEDSCDGGNTYGIIIKDGESKAIATISDGYVECL